MKNKVILGGTFDKLHLGHMKLIDRAFEEGEVTIGLVSDEMLKDWKPEVKRSFKERKLDLENYLADKEDWKIVEISDPYEKAVEGDYDKLVVSSETRKRGEKINEKRKEKGKDPLDIIEVKPVVAEDFLRISSTRIRDGDINEYGDRLTPVKVYLKCLDDDAFDVAIDTLSNFFECEFETKPIDKNDLNNDGTEINERGERIVEVPKGFEYGIAIIPGSFELGEELLVFEHAVIKDTSGYISHGHSPGIRVPRRWMESGENIHTLDSLNVVIGEERDELDPICLITGGNEGKKGYIKSALTEALLPRMNGEIYDNE